SGDRSKAHKAQLISLATRTETVAQGESYYFQTDDKNIITGMNVTAWIPEANEQMTGVIIPKSALIWYMDQAFVYIKSTEDAFNRRTLQYYSETADGYFIPDAIKPGEQIVTKGAQMLLSEELRGQIPKEDDD
ncbi:MAG: efflux RND transporter periplasmic adaptor subunit, partial [Methylococcaceae bacterium]